MSSLYFRHSPSIHWWWFHSRQRRHRSHYRRGGWSRIPRQTSGNVPDCWTLLSRWVSRGFMCKCLADFLMTYVIHIPGKRRLQIFGRDSTVRPGWLSLGPDLTMSNYDKNVYSSYFSDGQMTTGCSDRIESLRYLLSTYSAKPKQKSSDWSKANDCISGQSLPLLKAVGEVVVGEALAVVG